MHISSIGNDFNCQNNSFSRKKAKRLYLHNCIQPSFVIVSTTFSKIEDEIFQTKIR